MDKKNRGIRFFTSFDKEVWINKNDLAKFVQNIHSQASPDAIRATVLDVLENCCAKDFDPHVAEKGRSDKEDKS